MGWHYRCRRGAARGENLNEERTVSIWDAPLWDFPCVSKNPHSRGIGFRKSKPQFLSQTPSRNEWRIWHELRRDLHSMYVGLWLRAIRGSRPGLPHGFDVT